MKNLLMLLFGCACLMTSIGCAAPGNGDLVHVTGKIKVLVQLEPMPGGNPYGTAEISADSPAEYRDVKLDEIEISSAKDIVLASGKVDYGDTIAFDVPRALLDKNGPKIKNFKQLQNVEIVKKGEGK